MNEDIKELVKEMTTEEKTGLIHGAGLFRNSGVLSLCPTGLWEYASTLKIMNG